jgi:hypothetical protein
MLSAHLVSVMTGGSGDLSERVKAVLQEDPARLFETYIDRLWEKSHDALERFERPRSSYECLAYCIWPDSAFSEETAASKLVEMLNWDFNTARSFVRELVIAGLLYVPNDLSITAAEINFAHDSVRDFLASIEMCRRRGFHKVRDYPLVALGGLLEFCASQLDLRSYFAHRYFGPSLARGIEFEDPVIAERVTEGDDVVFPTLGSPSIGNIRTPGALVAYRLAIDLNEDVWRSDWSLPKSLEG